MHTGAGEAASDHFQPARGAAPAVDAAARDHLEDAHLFDASKPSDPRRRIEPLCFADPRSHVTGVDHFQGQAVAMGSEHAATI